MCMRVRVCVCLRKSWLKSSVLEGLVVLVHCHIMANKKESACESASVRRGKEAPKDGCNVAAKEKEDEDEEEGHC